MNTYRPATRTRLATLVVATLFLLPIGHALHAGSPGEGSGFIENRGQWPDPVRFRLQLDGLTMWITDRGALYDLREETPAAITMMSADPFGRAMESTTTLGRPIRLRGHMLRATFVDAADVARAVGVEESGGRINYLIGNDPERWGRNCRIYSSVRLDNLYDGIDALFYIDDGLPRYDLIAAPGADIGRVRMRMEGAEGIRLLTDGRLAIGTSIGDLEMRELISYQLNEKGERCQVTSRFAQDASGAIMFAVGEHDRSRPLVVDPLIFGTFIGGDGYDNVTDMAVGPDGSIYLGGFVYQLGATFPTTPGAYHTIADSSGSDAMVARLGRDGDSLIYATYLGGTLSFRLLGIAVNAAGEAFVAGIVDSMGAGTDFPATPGAFSTRFNGKSDGFVARLNADGSDLIYATLLGGASGDVVVDITLDDENHAYVTGAGTHLPSGLSFPTTPGAFERERSGAFVTKLSADGGSLLYSTFIGNGAGLAIDINPEGEAYVAGLYGGDIGSFFPLTPEEQWRWSENSDDAFITKVSADGSRIIYAGLLGGSGDDTAFALAVNDAGEAFVAGVMHIPSPPEPDLHFPTTPGAYSRNPHGISDIFVTGIAADGSAFLFSTLIGGSEGEHVEDIALDRSGIIYLTGFCLSNPSDPYPTTPDAFDPIYGFRGDAMVTALSSRGDRLLYSTFIGGQESDGGRAIDVDDERRVTIAGVTDGGQFPRTLGAYDLYPDDAPDGFVVKLALGISAIGTRVPSLPTDLNLR